jgi:hypothetical protein
MSITEKFNIEIFTDTTYNVGSADNINKYNSEYLEPENNSSFSFKPAAVAVRH